MAGVPISFRVRVRGIYIYIYIYIYVCMYQRIGFRLEISMHLIDKYKYTEIHHCFCMII